MHNPYLSIIIVGRNDNYGRDFNDRLQCTVHWLAHWVEHYQIATELLFVNYNPIAGNRSMEEQIAWPTGKRFLRTRIITVPPEIHEKYIDPIIRKTIPLFEFIAKNIGVRRAKGQFLLCTNADILFSEKIFQELSKKDLKKGCLYRCSRLDFKLIADKKLEVIDWEAAERKIAKHVFKYFLQGGTYNLKVPMKLETRIKLLEYYNRVRARYYRTLPKVPFWDKVPYLPKMLPEELFVLDYHCNACGDFALMDKASWFNGGEYPEDTWISTHTDSLHLMKLAVSNIQVEVWPYFIYHRDHQRRFDFSKKNMDMEKMYQRLVSEAKKMLISRKPTGRNNADWGLKNAELPENEF